MTGKIPAFEDVDVDRATVRITNAGDGLSEALRVAPKAFHMGDECYFLLRGEVTQINHRTDRDELVTRVHTVKASDITEVDGLVAERMLREAAQDLEKRKAELDGQDTLFRDDGAAFQGRSGVHPTARAASDDDDWDDDETPEQAERSDQAASTIDDAEQAALDAEALDESGTPAEVAGAARARVEGNVITPSFSAKPAAGH